MVGEAAVTDLAGEVEDTLLSVVVVTDLVFARAVSEVAISVAFAATVSLIVVTASLIAVTDSLIVVIVVTASLIVMTVSSATVSSSEGLATLTLIGIRGILGIPNCLFSMGR